MWRWLIPTIVGILVLLYVLLWLAYYFMLQKMRSDYNPYLKYFTVNDYPELVREDYTFVKKNGVQIAAFIYKDATITKYHGLVTFLHGIGAGHEAYTGVIKELCNHGYIVFAYDQSSCGLSGGDGIGSIKIVLEDLEEANEFLSNLKPYEDYPFFIMGHSLGGYASINSTSLRLRRPYEKIIAISPASDSLGQVRPVAIVENILYPVLRFYEFTHLKKFVGINGNKSIRESHTPTIVLHGDEDEIVPYRVFRGLVKASTHRENVQFVTFYGRRHQPHVTKDAETIIDTKVLRLASSFKLKGKPEVLEELKESIDFEKAVLPNNDFYKIVFDFLEN